MQRIQHPHIAFVSLLAAILLLPLSSAWGQGLGDIRITEISESGQWFELKNTANGSVDVSAAELCANIVYAEAQDLTVEAYDDAGNEDLTLAAGESTTVSLTHTFETTGDHDLAVGDAETTMRVYDSAFAFTDAEMERVETARIEESGTVEATIPVNGTTLEATADASATVLKNFSAETLYRNETTRTTVLGRTSVERTEEWVVDGTLFARTVAEGGERNYTREPSDEFEDSDELENETILDYLSTDHTDEEYVLVVEPETSAEAAELLESLGEGDSEALPVDSVDEIYFEIRYDRQTGRTTEQVVRFSGEGGESVDSFEFTLRQEYVAFNETVSVEVPDEVRDRATRSGTTVGAGTRASLPAAEAA